MIRRIGRVVLLGGVLVAVVLLVAFPTDEIARWVVAQATKPGSAVTLTFRSARLRPNGLHLEGAALRRTDGTALLDAPAVRISPSWLALLDERNGRPWSLAAELCGGSVDIDLDGDGEAQAVDLGWDHLDLGACLAEFVPQLGVVGFSKGEATLSIPQSDPVSGSGVFDLNDAASTLQHPHLGAVTIRADEATVRWSIDPKLLTIEKLSLVGPDLDVRMDGTVRLSRTRFGDGKLDLDAEIDLVPGGDPLFRRLLDGFPPDDDGTRRIHIGGSIDVPQVEPQ